MEKRDLPVYTLIDIIETKEIKTLMGKKIVGSRLGFPLSQPLFLCTCREPIGRHGKMLTQKRRKLVGTLILGLRRIGLCVHVLTRSLLGDKRICPCRFFFVIQFERVDCKQLAHSNCIGEEKLVFSSFLEVVFFVSYKFECANF